MKKTDAQKVLEDELGIFYGGASELRHKEAMRMAKKLFDAFENNHFNCQKALNVIFAERPEWFFKKSVQAYMKDLVFYGLAEESKGPRGGAGWKIISTGPVKPKF